jgi:hypothetical protein
MKCLTPECTELGNHCRGLCLRCYRRLVRRVQRGKATWGSFVEQGLAQRATKTGGSRETRRAAYFRGKEIQKETKQGEDLLASTLIALHKEMLATGYDRSGRAVLPEERQCLITRLWEKWGIKWEEVGEQCCNT